jgi:hypothetical protein
MALTTESKIYLKKIPKAVTVQRTRISGHSKKTAQFPNFDACIDEGLFLAPSESRNQLIKVSLKKGIIRYKKLPLAKEVWCL